MAFLDHEGGANYPYEREVVFDALVAAIPRVKGMRVDSADKVSGRIVAKAGVSLMSWGENVPIEVNDIAPGQVRVSITSTPKTGVMFGGAFDLGKNRRNIEAVLLELAKALANVPPTVPEAAPAPTPAAAAPPNPADRLLKLKDLADQGLISAAEFDQRREEILGEI